MSQRFSKPCPWGFYEIRGFEVGSICGLVRLSRARRQLFGATQAVRRDENAVLSDRRGLLWIGTGTRLPHSDWGRPDPRSLSDFPAVFADPVMDFQSNHCAMIPPTSPLPELVGFPRKNQSIDARIAVRTTESEHWGGGRRQRRDLGMDVRFRLRKHGDSQW